jgi:hypothetical protein
MQTLETPEADVTTMPCEVVVRASCGSRPKASGRGKEVQLRKLQ